MRYSTTRARRTGAALITMLALGTGGCQKLTPSGGNPTMTLLRDGSEKVCVADDVHAALREMISPTATELDAEAVLELRRAAVAGISFRYKSTTLKSFDSSVARAACNTTIILRGPASNQADKFRVDYDVIPSAESPASFVVSAVVDDAHAFARSLADSALEQKVDELETAEIGRQEAQQKQQVLASISEKWLLGAWIGTEGESADCGNGQAIWFEPAHVLEGLLGKGRWSLAGDQLHIVGGEAERFDATGPITRADPISFTVAFKADHPLTLRRCTRAETETLPDATSAGSVQE